MTNHVHILFICTCNICFFVFGSHSFSFCCSDSYVILIMLPMVGCFLGYFFVDSE